ncbi:MAG TPA: pectin acetylesterase-family hydrolase [Polyangiales bacterium]
MLRALPLASAFALALVGCGSNSTSAPTTSTDAGATDGGARATDGGAQITGLAPRTWTWVPFPDAHCRDGSSTGLGISVSPKSTKLMIYLEGGGACFNSTTCKITPSCFSESGSCSTGTFNSWKAGTASRLPSSALTGIFDRTNAQNPVGDWNMVYVPFCTGDVFAGTNPSVQVPGVPGTQEFVGYANISLYLARLVPTFRNMSQVLLTGSAAGGIGAEVNYLQVAAAFGSVPVQMLDDSGPLMEDPYVPRCLQAQWSQLWGIDKVMLPACGADCPDKTNYYIDAQKHLAKRFSTRQFGLIDAIHDGIITQFYGFGANNCAPAVFPSSVPAQTYLQGLQDIRTKLAGSSNFGSFLFNGTDHPTLSTAKFYTLTAGGSTSADGGTPGGDAGAAAGGGGVLLTDWIKQFLAGTVTNVGP